MPPLPDALRSQLEKAVIAARDHAEAGAREALGRLYVDVIDSRAIPDSFPQELCDLRVRLRAHARQLGDRVPHEGPQQIDRLVAECAYEFWHRMLFARFLAENGLLIHPEHNVPLSVQLCKELAEEQGTDAWELASRFAARMLPQIFRPDDPLLQVPLAPEHQQRLEKLLAGLPAEVFTADDSLGWVYQFWQTKRKREVNESEVKIGGDELPAVTQLFTEPYMVQFLLHNTLGAWWWARQREQGNESPALPGSAFEYLRFREDGSPAAGTFPGWPKRAAELKVMDPCCGSGHFLVAAFELLVRIRMHDEGLPAREACDAVLHDNLFGLELDARCTQIAAFNLALAAWKFPEAGGYRALPQMNIACSGLAPKGRREDWLRLAAGERRIRLGIDLLYDLFQQADDLGSLIDPRQLHAAPGFVGSFEELQPYLETVLKREDDAEDAELEAVGIAAQGVARAASLLSGRYHLVITNVPYLARGKQSERLKALVEKSYPSSKTDLATVFLSRCVRFLVEDGTLALVSPQNWWFLSSYSTLRHTLLTTLSWQLIASLGEEAWQSFGKRGPLATLSVLTLREAAGDQSLVGLEASGGATIAEKQRLLQNGALVCLSQEGQRMNPDHRVVIAEPIRGRLLGEYANSCQGIKTGDDGRYRRTFWELPQVGVRWRRFQGSVENTQPFSGFESLLDWEAEGQDLARLQGLDAWGKGGIAVSQMRYLTCSLYCGDTFDSNVSPIIPHDPSHIPALWAYCSSEEYAAAIRQVGCSPFFGPPEMRVGNQYEICYIFYA